MSSDYGPPEWSCISMEERDRRIEQWWAAHDVTAGYAGADDADDHGDADGD